MADRETGVTFPSALYHWAPTKYRASIEEHGLRPGSPANAGGWTAPHVCYAETPSEALGLTTNGTGDQPLDLWMVRPTRRDGLRLANEGVEWRTRRTIAAWWVALREPYARADRSPEQP